MIKRIILTLVQFVLYASLFALGGYWDAVNLALEMQAMQHHRTPSVLIPVIKYPVGSHVFIANGLIFATVLLVLILLLLLLRKKLHPWAWLTVLAYVLAVCLGLAMKIGLPPGDSPTQDSLVVPCLTLKDASLLGRAPGSASFAITRS